MKNPHLLSSTLNRPMNQTEPVLISVPGANKKFKRKSREPKRLFRSPEPVRMKTYSGDISDVDSVDDTLAPLHTQQVVSKEMTGSTTGPLLGNPEDKAQTLAQSCALDMRISSTMPAITSKLSQLPASPFSNLEISHWPAAISQPLSNRLKVGLRSTFPLSTVSSRSHSPSQQDFHLEPGPQLSHTVQCHEHVEPQAHSPKESPRKRVGMSSEATGRLPEVKAIQQTRRLLANARERTRVHTISAAFEALRKQVPCYSYGQKLSKLAILRIACNYILSLAQLAELDYSSDHSSLSFSHCVEQCTRTLQAEGRSKKRKVGRIPEDV